jgi:tRNA pseudouridine55 synthase
VYATGEWQNITSSDIERVLPTYRGKILQQPPMFSAKKMNGVRLYKLAHSGLEVERPAVPLEVFELELVGFEAPFFTLSVTCSSGFYVRKLIEDVGNDLQCGAIAYTITRTRIGAFGLDDALCEPDWNLEHIEKAIEKHA